jgi:hypothetical protein
MRLRIATPGFIVLMPKWVRLSTGNGRAHSLREYHSFRFRAPVLACLGHVLLVESSLSGRGALHFHSPSSWRSFAESWRQLSIVLPGAEQAVNIGRRKLPVKSVTLSSRPVTGERPASVTDRACPGYSSRRGYFYAQCGSTPLTHV